MVNNNISNNAQNYGSDRFPVRIEDTHSGRLGNLNQQGYIYNIGDDYQNENKLSLTNNSIIKQNLQKDWQNLEHHQNLSSRNSLNNKNDTSHDSLSLSRRSPSHISYNIGLSNPTTPTSNSPINYYNEQVCSFNKI